MCSAFSLEATWVTRLAIGACRLAANSKKIIESGRVNVERRYQQYVEGQKQKDTALAVKDINHAMGELKNALPEAEILQRSSDAAKAQTFQAGANQAKTMFGGRQTSLNVEKITINHESKKGFWETFFNFLNQGKNGRVLATGVLGGSVAGYGAGRFSAPSSKPVEHKIVIASAEEVRALTG